MSIPKQGDIYEIDLPEFGAGRRGSVLTLSVLRYNKVTGLMLAVPVVQNSPTLYQGLPNIRLDSDKMILADQIKNVAFSKRRAQYVGAVEGEALDQVLRVIASIMAFSV